MKDGMGTEKENELSYLCGMIQSGKISHKDAIHYLDLMKEEYELEEKQFDGLYAEWIRNGDIGRELNRILGKTALNIFCFGIVSSLIIIGMAN